MHDDEPEYVNVIRVIGTDPEVIRLLARTPGNIEQKFLEVLCFWLMVYWLDVGANELNPDVETVICNCATDAFIRAVQRTTDDFE